MQLGCLPMMILIGNKYMDGKEVYMKVDITQQSTLRTPAIRRQFVTPFPVTSDDDDVTRKLSAIRLETQRVKAVMPGIARDDSPYQSVRFAVLAVIMTTITGVVLLATRHTDG